MGSLACRFGQQAAGTNVVGVDYILLTLLFGVSLAAFRLMSRRHDEALDETLAACA